ncbi:UDP-N-acetylmuramate dehydrogenase [Taylorella equigenitalis]|uniref:UDP-N-acetylenolpyruvoylglucosamine reductase n=1 Tax=Taylorella equigenitalis (strain MCE9) TaxID=937774 RepID=A0A654KFG3_TAYEM|nr:UDP-N-acetylmuramate dehydrogenase [Taylorella equigenitalis]ADU91173.1 UDP-N-acetylenolpyruvoylglucosamine reductase [Taylorella equigenitalis MCE9]ASY42614.1 UDP-N-acetylenolpyruvoylglucosamine reductase [Taylorella equigenitalis]RBA26690.1 UDP-N-acetylmuramate dehydrogenase [Taylorella equigenitalis]WDU49036.1 UDP-N-acetylmuramate dehydrogenase [Taylorella equigenitalis]WDU56004.1 UDP-N-acetylmuramate dehydrogenase [Taylorella equigenitalis]
MTFLPQKNFDLTYLNTFRLSSKASYGAVLETIEDVPSLLEVIKSLSLDYFVLGGGSNVILRENIDKLAIVNRISGLHLLEDSNTHFRIQVGAGENWHKFVVFTIANDMPGLENLALIPGTVGAAPVQNIGAYGKDVSQFVESVRTVDLDTGVEKIFSHDECKFVYRNSYFKANEYKPMIVSVDIAIPKSWKPDINYADLLKYPGISSTSDPKSIMDAVIDIRTSKLPDYTKQGNAGSFFLNPYVSTQKFQELLDRYPNIKAYPLSEEIYKVAAGWLIDKAGWKGRSLGTPATVHEHHALVIVNNGGATASDILELSDAIKNDVFNKFGIMLEPEPRII